MAMTTFLCFCPTPSRQFLLHHWHNNKEVEHGARHLPECNDSLLETPRDEETQIEVKAN